MQNEKKLHFSMTLEGLLLVLGFAGLVVTFTVLKGPFIGLAMGAASLFGGLVSHLESRRRSGYRPTWLQVGTLVALLALVILAPRFTL